MLVFLKNGPSPASFSLFSSFQYTVNSKQMFNKKKKIYDDGIRTADLWYRKRPVSQLSHTTAQWLLKQSYWLYKFLVSSRRPKALGITRVVVLVCTIGMLKISIS